MVELVPGREHRQRRSELLVENRLEPGRWLFRLVAVDAAGNASRPAELTVTVTERRGGGRVDPGRLREIEREPRQPIQPPGGRREIRRAGEREPEPDPPQPTRPRRRRRRET